MDNVNNYRMLVRFAKWEQRNMKEVSKYTPELKTKKFLEYVRKQQVTALTSAC